MTLQKTIIKVFVLGFMTITMLPIQAQAEQSFADRLREKLIEQAREDPSYTSSRMWQRVFGNTTMVPAATTTTTTTPSSRVTNNVYRTSTALYQSPTTYVRRQTTTNLQTGALPTLNIKTIGVRAPADFSLAKVDLFELSLSNPRQGRSSTTFTPSLIGDTFSFRLQTNNRSIDDLSFLGIEVEGQVYRFDANGNLDLRIPVRVSGGDSAGIRIAVVPVDLEYVPRDSGSFRLELLSVGVREEGTDKPKIIRTVGTRLSEYFTFSPAPTNSGETTVISSQSQIYGKNLTAGEQTVVLALNLEASYDDMALREITVRNQGVVKNNVDSLIQKIELINPQTGEVYGSTRFSNGAARFQLRPALSVLRGRIQQLAFRVTVVSQIPQNITDTSFALQVMGSDIELVSKSTGANVPLGNIDVTGKTETFTISQGGLTLSVATGQLVATGTPNQTLKLQVRNNSGSGVSLGRVSFQIGLDGVEFAGGTATVDDFALVSLRGNTQVGTAFNVGNINGSIISFDANDELYISPGSSVDLGLNIAFDNVGSSRGDSVAISILGDTGFGGSSTLAAQRASGAKFIWSDNSAKPHSTQSRDWLTGAFIDTLPSSSFFISR